MLQVKNKDNHQKKGFTLIELLVVIAIIGILSAIGLVSLNGAREKARDAQRKSDLGQMNTALILFYDDNGSTYPAQATAATDDTKADCISSAGAGTDITVGNAAAAPAGIVAAANLWDSGGAMIPSYLSREVAPPGGGAGWQDYYCYDTNEVGVGTARDSYVIWGGLEAGAGTTFFTINSEGLTGTAKPGAACSAQDTCSI